MDKLLLPLSWVSRRNSICSEFWDCIQGQAGCPWAQWVGRAGPAGWFPEAVWMMWIPGMLKPSCQAVVSQAEVGAACCPTFPTALAPSSKAFLDMAVVLPVKSEAQKQLSNLLGGMGAFRLGLPVHLCRWGLWVLWDWCKDLQCESSWVPLLVTENDQESRTRGFLCGQG